MLALHEPSPYLFTCQGRPLITDTFNKRLKKYTTEIDIPYLSTHKLRFTSASLAKNQGQCEQDIQHNLGHSNIQQTQHYDSHATTEYNYGMAADIYDKKYNVTKCNQTFEHKKIAPNLDKLICSPYGRQWKYPKIYHMRSIFLCLGNSIVKS